MKRWRLLVLVFCAGCNALVGNDLELAPKDKENPTPASGHPTSALVSAGEVAKSNRYKMVFTVGQTSVAQGRASATQYSMDNGLICKDGR